ncbi:hypothetical protein TNCV_5052801 [Trichonephila clavipes]|nr:hypothetical protein TNCV_5052801 [Trichonephila clavipes]
MSCVIKRACRLCEEKLLAAVTSTAKDAKNDASLEMRNFKKCFNMAVAKCGVSVDGTWQRRGHLSLNSCVAALSIDTGKLLALDHVKIFAEFIIH